MSKARKSLMAFMILVGTCVAPMAALQSMGQELTDENGNVVAQNTAQSSSKKGGGFVDIVFGSGVVGTLPLATALSQSTSRLTASFSSSPRSSCPRVSSTRSRRR